MAYIEYKRINGKLYAYERDSETIHSKYPNMYGNQRYQKSRYIGKVNPDGTIQEPKPKQVPYPSKSQMFRENSKKSLGSDLGSEIGSDLGSEF